MATPSGFTWGSGGQKITTPQQAERQRQIAEALISQSSTPATNWAAGLGDVAAAFSGTMLNNQASAAEEAGRLSAAQSLAGIGPSSDFSSVSQALANPWLSQPQASVASALLSQNLERSDPSYQLDMAYKQAQLDALQNPQASNPETFFGTPIPYQNEDGSIGFAQLGNQGTTQPIQLPEGASPAPTTRQVDTGTEIITQDIYGNELFRTPKDIRGAEREQAIGTAEGAGIVAAPGDIASAEMALDLLNQIETNPELPWATGQSVQFGGNTGLIPGTQGRMDFQNLVNQATSGAFLTAISEMRGLGSLSNAEGQTATAAVTRMNTATSEAAFRKALSDYREVIQRGLDKARARLPGSTTQNTTPPADTGWQDLGNGIRIRPMGQ